MFAICCLITGGIDSGILVASASAQDTAETIDIFFDSNESGVNPDDRSAVMAELDRLKEGPDYSVVIEGYTDKTGEDEYNIALSRKRAEGVKKFIVDNGVEAGKIEVQGKGKTDKFASGLDEESLRQNRRVRIIFEIAEADPVPPSETEEAAPPAETPEAVPEESAEEPDMSEERTEAEPVPPALTEPVPPPSGLYEAIEKSMRKLAAGRVIFDAPGEMKVGNSYIVEADVPYSFVKDLSESVSGMSEESEGGLSMGKNIGVRLKGRGFDINPIGENNGTGGDENTAFHKPVMRGTAEKWVWTVSPLKSGFQSLLLSIEVMVEDGQYNEMLGDYPVFQKVVDVKPNFIHLITGSYAIMAGFIIIVIAVVGWVLVKKMKVS